MYTGSYIGELVNQRLKDKRKDIYKGPVFSISIYDKILGEYVIISKVARKSLCGK